VCLQDDVIPVVSTTKGRITSFKPDASAIIDLPRRQYIEVRIIAMFLTPNSVDQTGDKVFEMMRSDSTYRFSFMLNGASTFSAMSTSLLAMYASSNTRSPKSGKSAQRVVNPKLTVDTTPKTKAELFDSKPTADNPNAKVVKPAVLAANHLPPPARKAQREVPRGENPLIAVKEVSFTLDGVNGVLVGKEDLTKFVKSANLAKSELQSILSPLQRGAKRLYGKARSFLQASSTSAEEFKGVRGRCLADWVQKAALAGEFFKPAVILLRHGKTDELGAVVSKKTLQLSSIFDVLVYFKCGKDTSVSDLGELGDVFVVCKANAGKGSFGGTSRMDIGVLHKVLSGDVSFFLILTL
jgi:hypothetical protein